MMSFKKIVKICNLQGMNPCFSLIYSHFPFYKIFVQSQQHSEAPKIQKKLFLLNFVYPAYSSGSVGMGSMGS